MRLAWSDFKAFIDARAIPVHEKPLDDNNLLLEAYDGPVARSCKLRSDTADYTEYVADYQANSNPTLTDGDGYMLQRPKMAPKGWTFQARAIEFETAKLGSIYNKKHDGSNWNDATLKFYDDEDNELTTQGDILASGVKTVLDWEPLYDYEVVGGFLSRITTISQDVRCHIIAIPDLTEGQGGSKLMVSGINLQYIDDGDRLTVDGRTSKRLNYNATYHTNKLRIQLDHPAGSQNKLMVVFEHYKA